MKKLFMLVFIALFLTLSGLSGVAQNATISQAADIFKYRFIPLNEARTIFPDLPEALEIPYTEEELWDNHFFWLVPAVIKDVPQYLLVHGGWAFDNLLSNKDELSRIDTLTVKEAEKVVTLLGKLRPHFPHFIEYEPKDFIKFFYTTKDKAPTNKSGMKFQKAIAYDIYNDGKCITVNLPGSIVNCTLNSKYIDYMVGNYLGFEFLKRELPETKEENYGVSPLRYLKSSKMK